MNFQSIGLIGFGEVGKIFAKALRQVAGVSAVSVWDKKFQSGLADDEAFIQYAQAFASHAQLRIANSLPDLCQSGDLIICAVTASNTQAVVQEASASLRAGQYFLDLNSASPGTKQACAQIMQAVQAHYVEAGVMTSVPPHGLRTPMLLGGQMAQALAKQLTAWGMDATPVSEKIGIASAIKMSRSVMIKGLEALVIESYATARAYGVEDYVLPTLQETFPSIDWEKQGAYFFSRVVQHGKRRAEEMREAARTVQEAGFEPLMTSATAAKQQWVADQALAKCFAGLGKDAPWQDYADRLLARLSINSKR